MKYYVSKKAIIEQQVIDCNDYSDYLNDLEIIENVTPQFQKNNNNIFKVFLKNNNYNWFVIVYDSEIKKIRGEKSIFKVYKKLYTDTTDGDSTTGIFSTSFILDKWFTYFLDFHKQLKNINPNLHFLQAHKDNFLWDNDKKQIELNFFKQNWLLSVRNPGIEKIRVPAWWTNARKLFELNYHDTVYENYEEADNEALGKNLRYHYILCKSSSIKKIRGINDVLANGNNKVCLLYFQKYNNEYDLITAAQRVVIDDTETNIVPLSSGELIKSFSSDVPPSLVLKFCEELQNKSKDLCEILQDRKIKYYDNDYGIKTFNIKNCMLIDSNTTIDFTIRNYLDIFDIENNDNIDNLGKRFWNIWAQNQNDNITPGMLTINIHPYLYHEEIKLDDNYVLRTSMEWLKYVGDLSHFEIPLKAHIALTNGFTIIYDFGKYNNELNINWNNTYSSLRFENPNTNSILGNATADYYDRNITAGWTNTTDNVINHSTSSMDYGLGLISDILSFFNPMKILTGQALENAQTSRNLRNANTSSKMFGNAVHFGVDRYQQQEHYNMGRAGILGTSSNFISNPFIANYGVNEIDENGDIKLFNTYCVKLPDYVEKQISAEYLINGYACDIYQNYIEYDNNILTNKIKIASGDNSYIINILNHPVDEYNNIYCKNEFCNLLNNGIILIKKDELINDYIPISYNNCFRNVQINKIPVPLNKTYIGNFILESDTSKIQKIETYPINKNGDFTDEAKQLMNFVDDLGVYGIDYEIEHDLVNAMFTINILEANKKYYGNITRKSGLFYFMQPHELFITRDDLYINRLKNILSNKIEPINQMYCNVNEISITNLIDKICVKMHNKKNLDEFFLFDNCICLDNYSGKKWFNWYIAFGYNNVFVNKNEDGARMFEKKYLGIKYKNDLGKAEYDLNIIYNKWLKSNWAINDDNNQYFKVDANSEVIFHPIINIKNLYKEILNTQSSTYWEATNYQSSGDDRNFTLFDDYDNTEDIICFRERATKGWGWLDYYDREFNIMIDSFNDLTYGNIYTFTLTYAPNSTMSAKVLRLSRTEDDI